jgi:hypothetical protein
MFGNSMRRLEFTKQQRTKILPLRWFANAMEFPAHYFLDKCLYLDHIENFGTKYKIYSWISSRCYKPVFRWGTYYSAEWDENER